VRFRLKYKWKLIITLMNFIVILCFAEFLLLTNMYETYISIH